MYRILEYIQSNPWELKILSFTTFGSMVAPIDMFLKFMIPIASAVTWYFLRPLLDKWRKRNKKAQDK